jgi:hypothetical protein
VPLRTPVVSLKVTPDGKSPVRANEGDGVPVAVTVKVPAVSTLKVTLSALVMVGAVTGPQPPGLHALINSIKTTAMPTKKSLFFQPSVFFMFYLS